MKKLLLLFVLITCIQPLIQAQEVKQKKISLQSISSVGMLNGSSGAGVSIQSILGVSVHRSFAGLGIGIDQYGLRSVPLFIDIRQELGGSIRNIFLYGDGGYNFNWLTDKQKTGLIQYDAEGFRGGLYYDAGLGYTVRFSSGNALLLSAGFTYKELKDKVTYRFCNLTSCSISSETYTYHLPRFILKAGLRF